jgi:hypothetical protein
MSSFTKFFAVEAEFRLRVQLESIGFDRLVTCQTQSVAAFCDTAQDFFDLSDFLAIPGGEPIEEINPALIGGFIDPLSVLFDLAALSLKMP